MIPFALILPAAGSGTRLGGAIPKPFLEIAGRSLLEVTLARFAACGGLTQVLIPVSDAWRGHAESLLERSFPDLPRRLVPGGRERQDSIRNALRSVDPDVRFVAVHDAVRPFIPPQTIRAAIGAARDHGAAVVAVPAKDTIKRSAADADGSHILDTPDRSTLWQAQTPQIFATDLLHEAYRLAERDGFTGTDDASLVERMGVKVRLVEGPRENLKITYPVDLRLAELLLREEQEEETP